MEIGGVTDTGRIIWLESPLRIGWVFFSALIAMFAFASFLQGQLVRRCSLLERLLLCVVAASTFKAAIIQEYLPLGTTSVQVLGVSIYFAIYFWQKRGMRSNKKTRQ